MKLGSSQAVGILVGAAILSVVMAAGIRFWINPTQSIEVRTPTENGLVRFSADRTVVFRGDCATVSWQVENASAVYLNSEAVAADGEKSVCPVFAQTNRNVTNSQYPASLYVQFPDGASEEHGLTFIIYPQFQPFQDPWQQQLIGVIVLAVVLVCIMLWRMPGLRAWLSQLPSGWSALTARRPYFVRVIAIAIISVWTLIIYGPGLAGALGEHDILVLIGFVRNQSPLTWFYQDLGGGVFAPMYRPLYGLQVWFFYKVFGYTWAGYQAIAVLWQVLAAVVIYFAAHRIVRGFVIPVSLALLFSVYTFEVQMTSRWVADTHKLAIICAGIVFILLTYRKRTLWWHVGLAAALVLGVLSKESGLATAAALLAYAAAAILLRWEPKRDGILIGVNALTVLVAYFAVRFFGTTIGMHQFFVNNNGTLPFRLDISSILALAAGTLFPVFDTIPSYPRVGGLFLPFHIDPAQHVIGANITLIRTDILMTILLVGLLAVAYWLRRKGYLRGGSAVLGIGMGMVVLTGFVLVVSYQMTGSELLQSFLSLGIFFAVTQLQQWSTTSKRLELFAAALIPANAVAHGFYFEPRLFYIGFVAWIILVALMFRHWGTNRNHVVLRSLAACMLILAVAVNSIATYQHVPEFHVGRSLPTWLCRPELEPDIVLAVVQRYQLGVKTLAACRPEVQEILNQEQPPAGGR